MSEPRINYVAIVTCVVFQFILTMFWYSPWVFGELWFTWGKTSIEAFDALGIRPYVMSIVASFVVTYTLAWLIMVTRSDNVKSGAKIGFIVWAGIIAPFLWAGNAYKGYGFELSALESGCDLLAIVISGAVLGSWRRR